MKDEALQGQEGVVGTDDDVTRTALLLLVGKDRVRLDELLWESMR